jgi:ribosomal peptide maturation radical SAM protein 1
MEYRSKSPERALSEIQNLARKYGVPRFLVVDNILDLSYFKEVLPSLAESPEKLVFFYEIKSNVTFEQLRALKKAGVTWLQPGIESLNDEALKLMEKGTTSWINVQLLKWARELGLSIGWNILCGFPGESDDWYAETAELVPLIQHLEPSTELRPIRFDRFSPYQTKPEKFGLQLAPAWPYQYIYPKSPAVLARLVYGFEAVDRPPQYTNPLRIKRNEMPSLGGPGRDLLQKRIREWHEAFLSTLPPVLAMTEEQDATSILDTRSIAPERHVRLRGIEHRVHRSAHASGTPSTLQDRVNADGEGCVKFTDVLSALDQLVRRKLMVKLGGRYLALAVPGDMPSLPRNHREGYPGGWVQRPRRKRIPMKTGETGGEKHEVVDAQFQEVH